MVWLMQCGIGKGLIVLIFFYGKWCMPTNDNRVKRSIAVSAECPSCSNEEIVLHALRDCAAGIVQFKFRQERIACLFIVPKENLEEWRDKEKWGMWK
ncbi:unnamed protein product [Lupinus luteus]|uniref:Reverse transcriptase zinc-binding domain-containing protein n=1 Tax=Lupinus luteus TaxID=3873 RepID=A0AAV1WB18_LUPLU